MAATDACWQPPYLSNSLWAFSPTAHFGAYICHSHEPSPIMCFVSFITILELSSGQLVTKWTWESAIICCNIGDKIHVFRIWISITRLSSIIVNYMCHVFYLVHSKELIWISGFTLNKVNLDTTDFEKLCIFGILDPMGPSCLKCIWYKIRFIPRGHANSLCNGLNFSLVIG